jgi:hypothetical protein
MTALQAASVGLMTVCHESDPVAISAVTLIALCSPQISAAPRTREYDAETKSYSCAGPMRETRRVNRANVKAPKQYPYKQTVPPSE